MLKRFFEYYRPHRGLFILDFSCAILSGLLELGFPIAVKVFIDQLLPTQDPGHDPGRIGGLACDLYRQYRPHGRG